MKFDLLKKFRFLIFTVILISASLLILYSQTDNIANAILPLLANKFCDDPSSSSQTGCTLGFIKNIQATGTSPYQDVTGNVAISGDIINKLTVAGTQGGAGSRNFKVSGPGGTVAEAEFSALTNLQNEAGITSWTALYGNSGSVATNFAGVFKGKMAIQANSTTWASWAEALRFTNPNHSAITFPFGPAQVSGLMFGMHSNGYFYWGTQYGLTVASPAWYAMTLDGKTGNLIAHGTVAGGSSREIKKDISYFLPNDYQNILEKVKNTQVVNYRYKTEDANSKIHTGVIAEEAPEEIVTADKKSINYSDYMGFLLAAIKQQQKEIESLQNQIKELQAK